MKTGSEHRGAYAQEADPVPGVCGANPPFICQTTVPQMFRMHNP